MSKPNDDFIALLWVVIGALLISIYLMHLQDTHNHNGLQARLTDAKSDLEDARHDREMLLDCFNGTPLFAAGERTPTTCSMAPAKQSARSTRTAL